MSPDQFCCPFYMRMSCENSGWSDFLWEGSSLQQREYKCPEGSDGCFCLPSVPLMVLSPHVMANTSSAIDWESNTDKKVNEIKWFFQTQWSVTPQCWYLAQHERDWSSKWSFPCPSIYSKDKSRHLGELGVWGRLGEGGGGRGFLDNTSDNYKKISKG